MDEGDYAVIRKRHLDTGLPIDEIIRSGWFLHYRVVKQRIKTEAMHQEHLARLKVQEKQG